MQIVPTQPLPNQSLQIVLANQSCQIDVYQKRTGLFLDLLMNGTLLIGGVLCLNLVRIVRSAYFDFAGDLFWYDVISGTMDPTYTGIGSQYVLVYLEPGDLVADDYAWNYV